MTELERLRSIKDTNELAHAICDVIEEYAYPQDKNGCDICPLTNDCRKGHNAIQAYLEREYTDEK